MVKSVVHDPILLAKKSADATEADMDTARDLLDTLIAHWEGCVGMAANMIGVLKRIIVFVCDDAYMTMLNPEIIRYSDPYTAEEGCLSLSRTRKTMRYGKIKVRYQDLQMRVRQKTFSGWTAQIIQHEIDHCSGLLI